MTSERVARASHGLTDDVLTLGPRARSVRDYLREGVDQLASADPGLTQLRVALQAVLSIGLGVGFAYAFVKATGALQPKDGPAAVVQAEDHALLIVGMLISAMVAMMAGFTVTDQTARGQLATTLFLPFPMLAAMTIGIALGPYRIVSLIWLVVLLATAVYVRRFGPRGVAAGLVMFNGGFLGFFLHAEIRPRDVGWLAALLGIGVLASLVVRFVLFRPNLARTLKRMRRSWDGRAKRMLTLSAAVLQAPDAERRRPWTERLARQQVRLNECTLMIDAQLVESVPDSADVEAQRLFDADLALSNIARFASALADRYADQELRWLAQSAIEAVLQGDEDAAQARAADLKAATSEDPRLTVVAHRLAGSTRNYLAARRELRAAIADRADREPTEFTPAVTLSGGWLPGSGPISTEASTTRGRGGRLDHATMPPYVRGTIQVAVAATIAIVVGNIVSGQRLYWAVLATFLAFMATTNSGEQVRKALFRVGGTAIGIIVGDVLVHVTGGHVWSSLLIVMIALFLGIYLVRVNYTFMAIGITVTLSQLYAQLDEFSWHLLLLRLGETAIGVGAVIVTVLLVVPLRPQRVLTTGVLLWFRALSALVNGALSQALDQSLGEPSVEPSGEPLRRERSSLRPEIRELDAAYAALEAAAAPLRRTMFGRNSAQLAEIRSVSSAARHYARSFAAGVQSIRPTESQHSNKSAPTESGQITAVPKIAAAADQLRESMAAIEHRISTGDHGTFTRSASLIEQASRTDEPRTALALRDLTLLDGTLARLATALQMTVADHDTTDRDTTDRDTTAAADAGRAIADQS